MIRDPCARTKLAPAVFGLPTSRVSPRRATYFSLLRQRNLRKRKATRWSGSPALRGNLRCSVKAGPRSNSPSAQTIASPDPLLPVLLGPARRVAGMDAHANSGRRGRALRGLAGARSRIRLRFHHPSGCAEERRAGRIRTGDCLSAASSSPAPAGPSTAGCPAAKRRGRRQQGRLFFCLLFFWRRKRKVSCRRATPGLLADPDRT